MASTTARTLKRTPTGDLDISTGNLVVLTGTDSIIQAIRSRLQFVLGEWFLAQDAGVPYFTQVLVKNPNPDLLNTIFRDTILETPGVLDLTSLTLNYDRAVRTLSVTFAVTTDVGELGPTTVTL